MYVKLRIFFTILSAICLAIILPAIALGGWLWASICGGGAFLFYVIMLHFKNLQEAQETDTREPEPDFITNPKPNQTTKTSETETATTAPEPEQDKNL